MSKGFDLTPKQERDLEKLAATLERLRRPRDETTALAILFSQVGGRPQRDLWLQGLAVAYLVGLYGSRRKVAEKVGLSYTQIAQRHRLLTLPPVIKMMLA